MESDRKLAKAIQFVELGYDDILNNDSHFRSLSFQTDDLTTDQVQKVLGIVKNYNAFEGEKVAMALSEFKGKVTLWRFGRDGDPVVFVRLPYTTNQIEGQRSHVVGARITKEAHSTVVERLRKVFQKILGAEHVSADESNHELTFWWR